MSLSPSHKRGRGGEVDLVERLGIGKDSSVCSSMYAIRISGLIPPWNLTGAHLYSRYLGLCLAVPSKRGSLGSTLQLFYFPLRQLKNQAFILALMTFSFQAHFPIKKEARSKRRLRKTVFRFVSTELDFAPLSPPSQLQSQKPQEELSFSLPSPP